MILLLNTSSKRLFTEMHSIICAPIHLVGVSVIFPFLFIKSESLTASLQVANNRLTPKNLKPVRTAFDCIRCFKNRINNMCCSALAIDVGNACGKYIAAERGTRCINKFERCCPQGHRLETVNCTCVTLI